MTTEPVRLWHGGIPGLSVGELLLPPSVTGNARGRRIAADLAARCRGLTVDEMVPDDPSPDWVHFTPVRNLALAFAVSTRRDFGAGALYVVEPVGPAEIDPDFPVQGLRAHSARILRVYDPHVNISDARAASLHVKALAVERQTTVTEQVTSLNRYVRNAVVATRPLQTFRISPAKRRRQ